MSHRRQPYKRAQSPPPMRLTERDIHILETIHAFDGMMSLKQIDRLFFSGKGRSQPRARMRLLFDYGYISMPDAKSCHKIPLGETVYWLGKPGAELVAARNNLPVGKFAWRREPRWSWLEHDLAVNDFRICVQQAINQSPALMLHQWIPETNFLANPDQVKFKQGNGKDCKRQIRPDGFFLIRQKGKTDSQAKEFAFLLEIDMASHSNPRFAREKVRAGIAYLKSEAYQRRFGLQYGRWLVVTKGEQRLQHLQMTTERAGGNGLFYLTSFAAITPKTVLHKPVWYLSGTAMPTAIIPTSGCQ